MNKVLKFYKLLYKVFETSVLIKAIYGFFEILGGILFLISGRKIIDNLAVFWIQHEILQDPQDLIANYFIKVSNDFSASTYFFASFYLIFHGSINILLAVALFKEKLWAFPTYIFLFGFFTIYQVYRYFHTRSLLLLFLIIFDIFIILIIFLEYRRQIAKKVKVI